MFRQVLQKGPWVAVALGATGVAIAQRDRLGQLVGEGAENVPYKLGNSNSFLMNSSIPEEFKERKWDKNWDRREPVSLLNMEKYMAANDEQKKEMIEKVTPTATRNIFLIRHGQYMLDSDLRELTKLGREQAAILGERLALTEQKRAKKFSKCYISTMQRAKETADIILEHLPHLDNSENCERNSILEEGAPWPPEPPIASWRPEKYFYKDSARIEAAFRKYIHRAKPNQTEDSYELVVCHANVIRYFVCRALQFPPEGWLRISLANASITWIQIRPNGHVSLRALGDHGHFPPDKITFT